MIYTVGHSSSYRDNLADPNVSHLKLGRGVVDGEYYPGGWVWETKEEAQKHCVEGFEVFGIDADWEKDTEVSKGGDWHDLLVDAKFFALS